MRKSVKPCRGTRVLTFLCALQLGWLAAVLDAAELLPPGFRPLPLGVHALVGGRIVLKPGDVLERGTIVVRDGLIESVGKNVAPPPDARVWDMKGTTIYAGFIEPYLVLGTSNGPVSSADSEPIAGADLTSPGTRFFGTPGRPEDLSGTGPGYALARMTPDHHAIRDFSPKDKALAALREQGFTAGVIAPAKGIIRGTSALVALSEDEPNKTVIKPDVFQHIAFETRQRDDAAYPGSLMGVIAAIRQTFLDAQHYSLDHADYQKHPQDRKRPEFVPALEALAPALDKTMRVVIEPGSALMVERASRVAGELGLDFCIVSCGQEWRRPDLAKTTGATFIVPLDFPSLPKLPRDEDWDQIQLDQLRAWDWAPENPAVLREQGLSIALTTYGLGDRAKFHQNLCLALDRGLSEADALAALTTVPAKLCGADSFVGAIEPGKLANLTVVEGNNYFVPDAKVREVWIDGRIYRAPLREGERAREGERPREPKSTRNETSPNRAALVCSADLQSAVSPICNRQATATSLSAADYGSAAECNSAIRQIANLRYAVLARTRDLEDEDDSPDSAPVFLLTALERGGDASQSEPHFTDYSTLVTNQPPPVALESAPAKAQPKSKSKKAQPALPAFSELVPLASQPPATPSPPAITVTNAPATPAPVVKQVAAPVLVVTNKIAPTPAPRGQPGVNAKAATEPKAVTEPAVGSGAKSTSLLTPALSSRGGEGEKPAAPVATQPVSQPVAPETVIQEPKQGAKPVAAAEARSPQSDEKKRQLRELQKVRVARAPLEGRGPLAEPKAVLIQGATIWTCAEQGCLEDAELLVVGGKIKAIGKGLAAQADFAAHPLVIDGRGLHVTPGLIDCHSHTAILGTVNEGTLPSTAMVRIRDVVNSETPNLYEQLAGGVTTVNLLHGSANPIGGQNCVIKLRDGAGPEGLVFEGAPAGIKFALGENVKQSNWGDKFNTRFPQTRMGVRTFIANRFTAAKQYLAEWDAYKAGGSGRLAPRRDLELEALGEILHGTRWIHCHAYRQDEMLMLMRLMESFGVRLGTFQHVLEGYKIADEIAHHGAGASIFSDWWAYKFEVYDAIPYNGSLLRERGVVVSFNSDSSELARRLYTEAAKAVKYGGTTEIEALKFVTLNPARQLRIDQSVGSLEPGKDADFAVWSKSPLDSETVCLQTWIEGKKYFDRAFNAERAARLDKERNDLLAKAKKLSKLSTGGEGSGKGDGNGGGEEFFRVSLEHEYDGLDRHCLDE